MKILLTGRNGQVGARLVRALAPLGEVHATDRAELDLADPDAIVATVRTLRPDLIVNAAAFTDVDRAESEPDEALAVNARAPRILAEEAARLGAPLVHYSTDYVFDGAKEEPYEEDDAPAPVSVYGRTKLLGEEGVRAADPPHLILRVAWVYGGWTRNFLTTMLDLFRRRVEVSVVDDQTGSPTWCREIAAATSELLQRASGKCVLPGDGSVLAETLIERGGLYHLAGPGRTTWHGFAEEIAACLRRAEDARLRVENIRPISSAEYQAAARRPRNSLLSSHRLEERFGITLPHWEEQVAGCVETFTTRREVLVG
jgi:dTDP-4-dehydrorhamnose reductase